MYEELVVEDGRVGGSITLGETRLPLWALIPDLVGGGAKEAADSYEITADRYPVEGVDFENLLNSFLCNLLNVRGQFARLLIALAAVETESRRMDNFWQEEPELTERVRAALAACLKELDAP